MSGWFIFVAATMFVNVVLGLFTYKESDVARFNRVCGWLAATIAVIGWGMSLGPGA